MLTVPPEKVDYDLWMLYQAEIIHNEGFHFANCETDRLNSNCHYLSHGCTGCLRVQGKETATLFVSATQALSRKLARNRIDPDKGGDGNE
jgi:hypothetical protein